MKIIKNFEDFLTDLAEAGFTLGGENAEGVFSLSQYFGEEIRWHTEDIETDPWEWRMRVLHERKDITYGKYFFKKSGYITAEWYPYFYAVRRGNTGLHKEYQGGKISQHAKRIYELFAEHKELPLHLIKQYGGFGKEDKSAFDRALTELQMSFYITMCGHARKVSNTGEEYGWSATVFCLTEDFFAKEVTELAKKTPFDEAYRKIEEHIYQLNPQANEKKVRKFLLG